MISTVENNLTLNKRLWFDIIMPLNITTVLCYNDAKLFYNILVHDVIMLESIRTGLPMPPIEFMQ